MRRIILLPLVLSVAVQLGAQAPAPNRSATDTVRFSSPVTLPPVRGYSHVVRVPAGQRLIFVAGQVALDSLGRLVGAGDLRVQTIQAFENIGRALAAAGATFRDVVKLNYYVLDAGQIAVVREVRDKYIRVAAPPASTLVEVRRLFRDDVLIEIEAIAATRAIAP